MNEQTVSLLRELAAKLGTTTEHMYGVLLRQVPIWVAGNLMWAAVFVPISFVLFREGVKSFRTVDGTGRDEPFIPSQFAGVVLTVSAVLAFGWGVMENVYYAVSGIYNPEFAVLSYILANVR